MTQYDFKGKVALVSGSSRGIGKEVALSFAHNGADVVINYLRKKSEAEKVVNEIKSLGQKAIAVKANVGNLQEVDNLVATTIKEFGRIDFFINNAVIAILKPLAEVTEHHYDFTFEVNVKGFIFFVQKVLPYLKETQGKIVSITSLGSRKYIQGYGLLGAAKAAVESLSRSLAVELAPHKINVNVVCGGPIDTEALKFLPAYEEMVHTTTLYTLDKRLGVPADLAKVVLFLCSDDANWIKGQTLIVDGGLDYNLCKLK